MLAVNLSLSLLFCVFDKFIILIQVQMGLSRLVTFISGLGAAFDLQPLISDFEDGLQVFLSQDPISLQTDLTMPHPWAL